jgi:hypothetical protein
MYTQCAAQLLAAFSTLRFAPVGVLSVWATKIAAEQRKMWPYGLPHFDAAAGLKREAAGLYNSVLVPLLYNSSAGALMHSSTVHERSTITQVGTAITLPIAPP